jgi:ABC-2 type transport system ATP-binding protein
MRVCDYLRFVARLKGVPRKAIPERLDWVIQSCGLKEVKDQVIRTLSKGYRQRVGLAQALIHDPRVLILDEPTSGLDPNQIREIRALIRQLAEGRTILLSTHILQEVESVCNRVLILHKGLLVYDTAEAQDQRTYYRLEVAGDSPSLPSRLNGFTLSPQGEGVFEVYAEKDQSPEVLLSYLLKEGARIVSFVQKRYNLEQIFFEYTHREESSPGSSPMEKENTPPSPKEAQP